MANNKSFKIKNGLQAGRYLGSNGTETAGTVGGNLSDISYDSKNFDVTTQENAPQGIGISSDGTKFYVVGTTNDTVFEYDLSTAYDISTATYSSVSFSVSGQEGNPRGVFFKPDGTKFYIVGNLNNTIYQYALSTAWDLSTASYESKSLSVSTQSAVSQDLSFSTDGTSAYVIDNTTDSVYQYTLTTAWDVSTGSYASKSFSVASQETNPNALAFTSDGSFMYACGTGTDIIYQYSLSTPYDVSTASYNNVFYDFTAQATSPKGIALSGDNKKMYISADTGDVVYQYSTVAYTQTLDLSTGTTFSFTPSGATTVSFTNPPATGTAIGFSVEIIGNGSAITWPSSIKWHLATAPTATATKELYTFVTTDGGTTYYGKLAGSDIA